MGFGALRSIVRPLSRTIISRTSTSPMTSLAASCVCPKPELPFISGRQAPWFFPVSNYFHSLTDTRFPKRRPVDKPRRKRASVRPPGLFFILNLILLILVELLLKNYLLDIIWLNCWKFCVWFLRKERHFLTLSVGNAWLVDLYLGYGKCFSWVFELILSRLYYYLLAGPFAAVQYVPGEPIVPNRPNEGSVKRRNEKKRMRQRRAFILVCVSWILLCLRLLLSIIV